MKMLNPSTIGTITEMKCQLYFMQLGYVVSVPTTPERYDFILDTGKQLYRIQAKTAHEVDNGFEFSVCSCRSVDGKTISTDYQNDNIDFFCTQFDEVFYLIPAFECGVRSKRLRLKPTKNNQTQGICFAKDYIATKILENNICTVSSVG